MTPEEMQALRLRCKPHSGDGHLELFKQRKGMTVTLVDSNMVTRLLKNSRSEPVPSTRPSLSCKRPYRYRILIAEKPLQAPAQP